MGVSTAKARDERTQCTAFCTVCCTWNDLSKIKDQVVERSRIKLWKEVQKVQKRECQCRASSLCSTPSSLCTAPPLPPASLIWVRGYQDEVLLNPLVPQRKYFFFRKKKSEAPGHQAEVGPSPASIMPASYTCRLPGKLYRKHTRLSGPGN